MAWWVTLEDGREGCVEVKFVPGTRADDIVTQVKAITEVTMGAAVDSVQQLPEPANPRWIRTSDYPSFCYQPRACAGLSRCPRDRVCND